MKKMMRKTGLSLRGSILTVMVMVLGLAFSQNAFSAGSCTKSSITWSSGSITVSGNVSCTLTDIKTLGPSSIPLQHVSPSGHVWFLGANLFLKKGAQLVLHGSAVGGDVDELRLKSNNSSGSSSFVVIEASWGDIDIDHTKITSWDESTGSPDKEYSQYGRALIRVNSYLDSGTPRESRMDISNSDIGYLGYNGGEAYGLSWKVKGGNFDAVGVYGDVVNNKIHHNYYGIYTYGAQGMTFIGNESYSNVLYGLDPHDDSDYLLIKGNHTHHNGKHGIICSKRCDHLTIIDNLSSYNGGHGIMLHRNVNDSLVENNQTYHNALIGIAIFDSHSNKILKNIAKYNKSGIRFTVGSSYNLIEDNVFSENTYYGIEFFKGSDLPTSGDGRPKFNTFKNNGADSNGSTGLRLKQADYNTFKFNSFTKNGSYAIYISDAYNNVFEGNTISGAVYP